MGRCSCWIRSPWPCPKEHQTRHTQPASMDEGGGQARDRLRHLVQRLVDSRGWILMDFDEVGR